MFRIHRSERADALVGALVDVLATPLADPFTTEIVAVPTKGVERWLTHRIAAELGSTAGRTDGVCANVDFPFPGRLVTDVLAQATGADEVEDPWRPERLVWPLLAVIDDHLDAEWMTLLAAHLGRRAGDESEHATLARSRRFATARHLATLFDRYGVYRPDLVLGWLAGDDDVPDDAAWQPELWRALRRAVGVPSPPERIRRTCERLRAGEAHLALPERVSLFGLTRLPATYLEVLRALATDRDVHLFALHPSLALWDRIAAAGPVPLPLPRAEDPTRAFPRNPLLATWGADSREMQLVLSAAADAESAHHPISHGPGSAGTGSTGSTLLRRLQDDICSDAEPPAPDARITVADDDRSVQIHRCHGRARQVEVVRDAIAHALADDPTLEPRDVIVMCPDVDAFAPLLHATFGVHVLDEDEHTVDGVRRLDGSDRPTVDRRGLPVLPYRLADRSLRQANPLLAALDALLELVAGRLRASEVLAFAGRESVRLRFRFSDDDLGRLHTWVGDANIRWGLDAEARDRYWLGDVEANTWRAGLDRLLLGVTMDTDASRLVGGRLPLDDVGSGDVELVGRFTEFIDRIDHVTRSCAGSQPLDGWVDTLHWAADALLAARPVQAWQRVQLDGLLRDVLAEATTGDDVSASELSLPEIAALLDDRLRGQPTRADFRTGAVTMCTLHPMRAVPHRVVCLVGLDDGEFPRPTAADGDDLLRRLPLVGDREPRSEDRQLLLDAVLAATDTLIVTTTARDPRTNEARPPAVPVAELDAVIDRTAHNGDVVRHAHPLQRFDTRAHGRAPVAGGRSPWSFDRGALRAAEASCAPPVGIDPFLGDPLPPHGAPGDTASVTAGVRTGGTALVTLDDLTRFLQHPVRGFLRQRLELNTWDDDDVTADAIDVELDGLQRWAIGDDLVRRLVRGDAIDDAIAAELAAGGLPPGALGQAVIDDVSATALAIRDVAESLGACGRTTSREIDLEVDPASSRPRAGQPSRHRPVAVVGTVGGVAGALSAVTSYSSVAAKHRLAAWIRLVALSAAHPDTPWQTAAVGRRKRGGQAVVYGPIDGSPDRRRATALAHLATLVDLRDRGLCEPIPLPCDTAAAWAGARRRNRNPESAAQRSWESGRNFSREDADPLHRRVWGGTLRLDEVLAFEPRPTETGDGWDDAESTRLGRLARRLWDPILEHEQYR